MKPKVGDVVEIVFLDHVEDGGDPYSFAVWGRIDKIGRQHYEILSWAHTQKGESTLWQNEKRFTIVRSAITKLEILKS
jgi:hypothetical protein